MVSPLVARLCAEEIDAAWDTLSDFAEPVFPETLNDSFQEALQS